MKKIYILALACVTGLGSVKAQQVVFSDNYAPNVSFVGFGGSSNNVSIDNTTAHSGTSSLEIMVPATGYTGGALVASSPLNLTAYNAVSFWVKASVDTTLDVSGFGNNSSTALYAVEYDAQVRIKAASWTQVIIPVPDNTKLTAMTGLFHFAQGSQYGAFTIWVDDIEYVNLPTSSIKNPMPMMTAATLTESVGSVFTPSGITISYLVNGTTENLTNVAPVYYNYSSSNPGIVSFDSLGNITAVKGGSTVITATLAGAPVTGSLNVTVTSLVAPSSPAPTPTDPASAVSALFNSSNVYVNSPIDAEGWLAPWAPAKLTYPYIISGTKDTILEFSNINSYTGSEFTQHEIDATTKKYFHISVWTPNVGSLSIKLVDFAPSGAYNASTNLADQKTFTVAAGTLVQGAWNNLVIDLDSLPGLQNQYSYMAQLLLVDNDAGAGGTVFVDNVYFSSQGPASTVPTTAAPTPTIPASHVTALFNSSNVYINSPIDTEGWLAPWAPANLTYPYIIGGTKDTILEFSSINPYTGSEFTQHQIDATTKKYFHISVWTPNVSSLSIKLVDFAPSGAYNSSTNLADQKTFTVAAGTLVQNAWNNLVIDLDSLPGLSGQYNYMAQLLLVDNDSAAGGTVFVDNVYFASPVSTAAVPTSPAPTPTIPAADVTALFNSSNVYVNSPIDTEGWLAPWAPATLTDPYIIGGTKDSILEFSAINPYTGSEFTQNEIDATSKKYFHISVWTPNVGSLSIKLVDFAPTGAYNASTNLADLKTFTVADGTLVQNAWNNLVIDLDSLPGLSGQYNYMAQLLLVDNDATAGGTVFVDNVYFATQGTLPVTFLAFNGVLQNNSAALSWSTTNEVNDKGYFVERSQDAASFSDIAFVAAKGKGAQVSNYTYSDPKLLFGANYYRIKQVDLDGHSSYSSVIKIDYSKFGWTVLGNGVSQNTWVQLQLDHKAPVTLQVYSLQGKLMNAVDKGVISEGTYSIPLNLSGLAHGVYVVKLTVDGNKVYSKMVLN